MRSIIFSLLTVCLAFSSASAQLTDTEKKEVRSIIKDYIANNPDVILKAVKDYDQTSMLKSKKIQDFLYNNKKDNSLGPVDAKVKIVEFFDYNCGFCKQSYPWVQKLLKEHPGKIRVIFKELPILERRSKTSRQAALAALAAGELGQYWAYHGALMAGRGKLSKERLDKIAEDLGLDMNAFHKAMQKTQYNDYLDEIELFAAQLDIRGTPFFLVNDQPVHGANFKKMQAFINQALMP